MIVNKDGNIYIQVKKRNGETKIFKILTSENGVFVVLTTNDDTQLGRSCPRSLSLIILRSFYGEILVLYLINIAYFGKIYYSKF